MQPYRTTPLQECGEPLVPIPLERFAHFDPHPHLALGADYKGASPWMLRSGVIDGLTEAQKHLQAERPGWRIMILDAYRPNAVQIFMVEHEFGLKAREAGLDPTRLTAEQRAKLGEKVYKYWAAPSDNPLTPPPHSTGSAIDITLADESGREVGMGSRIDEGIPAADPYFFKNATDDAGRRAHENRMLLRYAMYAEGFRQHPDEWWHFSRGDQLWAWLERETGSNPAAIARYGRADLVADLSK